MEEGLVEMDEEVSVVGLSVVLAEIAYALTVIIVNLISEAFGTGKAEENGRN